MDLSNIKVGDVYKNYPALCDALNIKPALGKGKKWQQDNIQRYLSYEKKGHSFTITEIFETPIEKQENKRNTGKHIEPMKILLLQLLQNGQSQITLSTTGLAQSLSMIHKRYFELKNDKQIIAGELGVSTDHIDDFMNSTTPAYKNAIKTILKELSRDNVIIYTTTYMAIYECDGGVTMPKEVSEYETSEILRIKRTTMQKYGEDMDELFLNGVADLFYDEVKRKLFEELGIVNYYKAYKITSSPEYLDQELKRMLKQAGVVDGKILELVKTEWNKSSMKRFENKHNQALKEKEKLDSFGELKGMQELRALDNYVPNMRKINNQFIPQKK